MHVPLSLTMAASDDNILIIGGKPEVSERIAINCARSLHPFYTQEGARFMFFNYTPQDDPYHNELKAIYTGSDDMVISNAEEASKMLLRIKTQIEYRQQHPEEKGESIYITIVALQYAYSMFTKNYKGSEDVSAIATILEQGPRVGVYTILQVDTLKSLTERISGKAYDYFNHRIALQMRSEDSEKIVSSKKANELSIEGKESSLNRAYYFNKKDNVYIKFRPYELDTL